MRPMKDDGRVLAGLLTMIVALFLALFFAIGISVPVDANTPPLREYEITELPSLGGATSANTINNAGFVAGSSDLPDGTTTHATLWRNGEIADLETVGWTQQCGALA